MRSLKKALRDVGIILGTAAATGGIVALESPEVLTVVSAFGPGGAVAVLVLPFLARFLADKLKHRPQA